MSVLPTKGLADILDSLRLWTVACFLALRVATACGADLAQSFLQPPDADRPWVYWWWLDGAASDEGITRDLEAMRQEGVGGVLLVDAGLGGPDTPKGPPFMSEEWREHFRHAVREAGRLGLHMSVNLCSGWNAGGPWIKPEDAIKRLATSEITVQGPTNLDCALPQPPAEFNYFRDIAVLACRTDDSKRWNRADTLDLTSKTRDGRLQWKVPAGRWTVVRFGFTLDDGRTKFGVSARTKFSSGPDSEGWEADPWSARAMDRHFAATAGKLIQDAGPLAGSTFAQVHLDSWETVQPDWTEGFLKEFRRRRGYDARPFLPALVGRTVDSPEITGRFLWDYRRTAADLLAANHYGRLGQLARAHGLAQDSQSGGPFFSHSVDALQCEGINEVPMGEFWKRASEPDGAVFWDPQQFRFDTARQAATAAHIYGRNLCEAEAFTSFAEDWTDDPWSMKDIGDHAFCNGLTRLVIHKFTHQPQADLVPGNHWAHVGTHFNRQTTWWEMSHGWLRYLQRCQHLLRQGRFAADVAYYYGEAANRLVLARRMMNPALPEGYDCDTLNAEVLLRHAAARNGRLVLPDGMSYRYLVLPHENSWKGSPEVLRKVAELVAGGVMVVGPRPARAPGLTGYPGSDRQVRRLADRLWGPETTAVGERGTGKGRVIWGRPLAEVLAADGLAPDVEFLGGSPSTGFDWIHRRDSGTDIYFVSNQQATPAAAEIAFRVTGRQPELWDAVTGLTRDLPEFREQEGRVFVPMRFAPRQSCFVVFRRAAASRHSTGAGSANFPKREEVARIAGPWRVTFDPQWGGPAQVTFDALCDWTRRPEEGIRFYSGTAIYRTTFDLPAFEKGRLFLNLGVVKNLAAVKFNGRDLGVLWTAPWRVNITDSVQPRSNRLEVAVVNLWPNRLIGDSKLPPEKRFAKTNVKTYLGLPPDFSVPGGCKACDARKQTGDLEQFLLPSGLLGPVTVEEERAQPLRQP